MSEITAILPQKKDKERCSIYIDGQFYCGMALETVILNRLKAGQSVDLARLDELQFESEKTTALDKAMKHLSASMKTQKEITDFLKRKGYVESVVDYVIEKLQSYGFVDDAEYARQYVQNAEKNKGKKLVSLELQRKGVAADQAEKAVGGMQGESEAAWRVLSKYMRGKEISRETLYKALRYLIGKGFDYDTAKEVLSRLGDTDEDIGI
jgi:regulatory protein